MYITCNQLKLRDQKHVHPYSFVIYVHTQLLRFYCIKISRSSSFLTYLLNTRSDQYILRTFFYKKVSYLCLLFHKILLILNKSNYLEIILPYYPQNSGIAEFSKDCRRKILSEFFPSNFIPRIIKSLSRVLQMVKN